MIIASITQNTSMTPDKVLDLTIPHIEDLFDGFAKANEESADTPSKKSKTLTDFDAIKHLIANKDIF